MLPDTQCGPRVPGDAGTGLPNQMGRPVPYSRHRLVHQPETSATKTVDQNSQNKAWVSLGAYNFKNQAPEVQLTNSTSDGAADKDVAYDAVAFVPGDYSGIPSDLTFSDPDVNAADPVPTETPNTIDGSFFAGSTSLSSKAQASSAASVITSKSSKALASPSVSAGETAACSVTENSMTYTRTNACIHDQMTVVHLTDGDPDGTAVFDYRNAIETDVNSDTFTQSTTIRLKSMSTSTSVSSAEDIAPSSAPHGPDPIRGHSGTPTPLSSPRK